MRQGSNGRRPRGRPNRKQHGSPGRSSTFDSNGPDGRIRGNAHQVYEKYLGLARDAASAGDRVAAEAFYQHAEHYFRIVNDSTDPAAAGVNSDQRDRNSGRGRPQRSGNGAREGRINGNGAQPQVEFPEEVVAAETPVPQTGSPEPSVDDGGGSAEEQAGGSPDQEEPAAARGRSAGGRSRRRSRAPRNAAEEQQAASDSDTEAPSASRESDEAPGKQSDSDSDSAPV